MKRRVPFNAGTSTGSGWLAAAAGHLCTDVAALVLLFGLGFPRDGIVLPRQMRSPRLFIPRGPAARGILFSSQFVYVMSYHTAQYNIVVDNIP